ncbi:MauE/DoxX family redox-associated membrane protein [Kitasatospora sp. NPDC089797]|uniref:MauE/DoxX family redox-associated membrane protein n=1 Tax=Kitasatospora sp. NPDC089797 TaxID=3155298 RepID=UPI00342508B8
MTAYLLLGCRVVIAVVFAKSALAKLRARPDFASALRVMAVLSPRLTGPAVLGVPIAEAVLALLVWMPRPVVSWAFAAAGGLIAVFAAVLVVLLRRGADVSCPCFGASGVPVGAAHVARNLVLLAVAAAGLLAGAAPDPGGLGPAGVVAVLLVAAFASALIIATDTLVELFSAAH